MSMCCVVYVCVCATQHNKMSFCSEIFVFYLSCQSLAGLLKQIKKQIFSSLLIVTKSSRVAFPAPGDFWVVWSGGKRGQQQPVVSSVGQGEGVQRAWGGVSALGGGVMARRTAEDDGEGEGAGQPTQRGFSGGDGW